MPGTHQAAVGVEGANGEICSQVAAPADSSGAGHGAEYDGRYHVVDHRERDVALVSRLVFGMVNSLVFDGAAGLSQLAAYVGGRLAHRTIASSAATVGRRWSRSWY